MLCNKILRVLTAGVGLSLLMVAAAGATAAMAQDELAADLTMSSADSEGMDMRVTVSADKARMDMNSPRGKVSTIWADGGMYIVMHDQKMFMHFSREMMEQMGKMMGKIGGQAPAEADEFDPSKVTFERTGKTDTIGGYDAFEVKVTGDESNDMAFLWMTRDAPVGMFELFSRMAEPLQSMNMPFMRGGDSPTAKLKEYENLARVQGLPEGKVIRVDNGDGTTMTLSNVATGPFDPSIWAPDPSYTEQKMPMMPRQ